MGMTLFAGRATEAATSENVMMGVHAYCRVTGDPAPLPRPILGHPCIVQNIDPVNHSHAPYLCQIQVLVNYFTEMYSVPFRPVYKIHLTICKLLIQWVPVVLLLGRGIVCLQVTRLGHDSSAWPGGRCCRGHHCGGLDEGQLRYLSQRATDGVHSIYPNRLARWAASVRSDYPDALHWVFQKADNRHCAAPGKMQALDVVFGANNEVGLYVAAKVCDTRF